MERQGRLRRRRSFPGPHSLGQQELQCLLADVVESRGHRQANIYISVSKETYYSVKRDLFQ